MKKKTSPSTTFIKDAKKTYNVSSQRTRFFSTNTSHKSGAGFTLIELLIYVAILAMVGGLFTGILAVAARFQVTQAVGNEVAQQLNFVTQTIQRLVRDSSEVELVSSGDDPGTSGVAEKAYLKLRMKDVAKDPTCVSLVEDDGTNHTGSIRVVQGAGSSLQNCKASSLADAITTPKVYVTTSPTPGIVFTKFSNAPGHDIVEINLTLNFAGTNPQSSLARSIITAIGRASAATFDSDLVPGANTWSVGQPGTAWKNGYFTGDVTVTGNITATGNVTAGSGSTYLQLKTYGSGLPGGTCSGPTDYGKLYLRTGGGTNSLYVCAHNGIAPAWLKATIN